MEPKGVENEARREEIGMRISYEGAFQTGFPMEVEHPKPARIWR